MKSLIIRFLKEEEGQTSTEYILLVAVVAMVIFKFKKTLEDKLVGDGGVVSKIFDGKITELLNGN